MFHQNLLYMELSHCKVNVWLENMFSFKVETNKTYTTSMLPEQVACFDHPCIHSLVFGQ